MFAKNRSRLRGLAALAAAMLLVSACGGSDDAAPAPTAPAPAPNAPAPEADIDPLDALYALALEEDGPIIWYESSPEAAADQIIAAFNARFPDIVVEHRRSPGGTNIAALVVQEVEANARTADVTGASLELQAQLDGRGLLMPIDPVELGIEYEGVIYDEKIIALTHALGVAVWNTELVSADEAPRSWEDLADPKWAGEMGSFERAGLLVVGLTEEWGREAVEDWTKRFALLEPFYYTSTFAMAGDVAAGIRKVGLGIHHTTLNEINNGAPVNFALLDPTAPVTVSLAILEGSPVPNSAKLLVGWLVSEEGAIAYEQATERGNLFVPGTRAATLLGDITVAEIPYSDVARMGALIAAYDEVFWSAGVRGN